MKRTLSSLDKAKIFFGLGILVYLGYYYYLAFFEK